MQMRSAEEAQRPAMDPTPPPASQDAIERAMALDLSPPGNEDAIAERDTTIFAAPEDPFAHHGGTVPPKRAQAATPREVRPGAATPPLPMPTAGDSPAVTTLTLSPNAAAGASYLFLWISGVLIFFNERRNTYVRFHALQSVLFGASATIAGVVGVVAATLLMDLGSAWHASVLSKFGLVCALLIPFSIVVIWWWLIVAAWTGHAVALPILGQYAKQYAAPENESPTAQHP